MDAAQQYLRDQVELVRAGASAEGDLARIAYLHGRLLEQESQCEPLPAQLLASRCKLSESEMRVLWNLVAAAIAETAEHDVPGLTQRDLAGCVYGGLASTLALHELSEAGRLRRLGLIEVSEKRPGLHESALRWNVSRRVLLWLSGEAELDPSVADFASVASTVRPMSELAAQRQLHLAINDN